MNTADPESTLPAPWPRRDSAPRAAAEQSRPGAAPAAAVDPPAQRQRQQQLQQLAQEFRDGLPGSIEAIEQALAALHWDEVRSRVHGLKGVAGSLGYPQLTRLAQPIEWLIEQGRHGEAALGCAQLLATAREATRADRAAR